MTSLERLAGRTTPRSGLIAAFAILAVAVWSSTAGPDAIETSVTALVPLPRRC